MREWIIHKLGGHLDHECKGFKDVNAAIKHIKKTDDQIAKHKILTEAVKHLFNTIGPEDILRLDGDGHWLFQERPMTEAEMSLVRESAESFKASKFWKIIQNDIKYQLNKKMYLEPNITMDVMWGKLMVFYNDIIQTRVDSLIGKRKRK